jgi:hypothetical protein
MIQERKNLSSPAQTQRGYPETGTKYYIILEHLRLGGSINKYEALLLGESCLSATICNMCVDFGLKVSRLQEKAKDLAGNYSYATRYKLTKQVIVKLNTVKLRGSDE